MQPDNHFFHSAIIIRAFLLIFAKHATMKQITPTDLKEWMNSGKDFILVDLREDWERAIYNIGGIHIPMGDLMARRDELRADKDVVLYCEKGIRSVIAIQRLELDSFEHLYNLSGGMAAWRKGV